MLTALNTDVPKLKNVNELQKSRSSIILIQEGIEIHHVPSSGEQVTPATVDDVYIHPSFIEFIEASEGVTCQQRITIKNTGKRPAFVRIYQPHSMAFQVKMLQKGVMINPGLSIRTTVTYAFKRPSFLRAIIPIEINGKILDYRVICKLLVEGISTDPKSIDFGIVDIGYSSGIKIITLKNEGGKSTRFSIDLGTNDLEITVKPLRGMVKPNKPVQVTVELIGMNEGTFLSEFWIKSVPNIRVPFKVTVIIPRLAIYHPNATGDFTLIDFSTTVANTRKYDSFVLRNVSSQVASYVVLGEVDNEIKCIRDINRKKYPVYSAFEIRPIQGRIGPFEGIIFEVRFAPTNSLMQWREKLKKKLDRRENDFMAFLRIVRVHVTETKDILRADQSMHDQLIEAMQSDYHRNANAPIMNDDSTSLSSASSSDSGLNDAVRLCLHGEVEEACFKFEPDILYFGDIYVGEDSQRVVRISNPLKFAPLLCSYVRNASVHCYPESMMLKPEGSIEVLVKVKGTENVSSSFEVYFDAAADSCESTKTRRQMKIKVGSYPVQCVVNVKLLVTIKQSCLSQTQSAFRKYHKDSRKRPKNTQTISRKPRTLPIEAKKADRKVEEVEIEEASDNEVLEKVLRVPEWKNKKVSQTVKCDIFSEKNLSALKTSTEVLIPLSPLQIYNIRMYPSLFNFGMVVPRSRNYRQLIVENLNKFPIMIRLTSLSSKCINFPEGNLIILPPDSLVRRLVEFRAYHISKFNGYIDYIINDNHSFELGVTANIVEKQLSLDTREITFGKEWLKEEIYQPMDFAVQIRNKLDARTNFLWEVPSTCCFFVEPMAGVVRGNATLFTYIHYKPNVTRANCTELTMKCEASSYITVRLIMPVLSPKASFIKDLIDVGEIPLNLTATTVALLRNFDYIEVEFEVDSSSLVHGCTVQPLHGVMQPRAIAALQISLTFSICFRFTMAIRVTVQKQLNLQLRITGNVSFPQLKLHPQSINLRRISASAYQHYLITASNVGTTMLKLNFLLEEYPEFRVSLSSQREHPGIGDEDTFIAPGGSQNFHLHFEPIDLASYAFYLPIVINDILGPANMLNSRTLKPSEYLKQFKGYYATAANFILEKLPPKLVTMSIDCTVAGHVVFFNKLVFHFNVLLNNVSGEFCIQNRESLNEKSVQIDISSFSAASCPFFIRWSNGEEPIVTSDYIECTLQQGEECKFILEFQPKSRGKYTLEAPIFIRDELEGAMFNKLCLIGEYPATTIESELSEIYFTPVPLNVPIERKFRLILRHFEKDTVITAKILSAERCSGKFATEDLFIQFLDTNVASASEYSEMEIRVVFRSEVPVSFRTNIEFSDGNGLSACPVTIYVTADNSLLTIHSYIRNPMVNLYKWSTSLDKRVSHISDSITDDEDYDMYSPKSRQISGPRISILSYFERNSKVSAEKLIESKLTSYEQQEVPYQRDAYNNIHKTEEEAKKCQQERRDSERSTRIPSVQFEEILESLEYPFFPLGDESHEYEIYMNQTLKAVEEWLYTGPFKFYFYPVIPSGITMSLSKYYSRKPTQFKTASRQGPELGLSFVGVLESLIGPEIYNHIGKFCKDLPEKDVDRANYVYNLYDNVLNLLIKHGAHLCHVSAQFLLSYDDYITLIDSTSSKGHGRRTGGIELRTQEKLTPLKFEHRSKQCWLDVLLQTYKNFILLPIFQTKVREESLTPASRRSTMHRESIVSSASSLRKQYEAYDSMIRNIDREIDTKSPSNNYSSTELFLLTWLNYHYEEERKKEWMADRRIVLNPNESKDVATARKIENFDEDLSDSLALTTLTAAYCPFLIEENLSNRYVRPRNYEEALHNAVCVVNAWRRIRLGFVISPLEIVYPNCVKMLMLVTYLFKILPTYTPRTKIKFSCPLSETVTRQINFTNPTSHTVGFLVMFLANSHGFFTTATEQPIVHLNGHKSTIVKIQFYAKKIKKTRAFLLFCGSTIGPTLGRNQVFVLEGQADSLGIANEYTICSRLYQVVDKTLSINVPYENSTEYEIWVSEERPSKPSTLKQTRWSELCLRKIPRRLFLNQKSIVIKENTKEAFLSVTVACITPSRRSFWIIFQSKLGDFIIQINSHWQPLLTDNIVVEWDEHVEKCICTEQDYNEMCPLNLPVPIPSRNKQLWSCVAHMFQKTLDPKERLFWSRYLDTHIGLRLIRWLMGDSGDSAAMEFTHIFDATVTYNVTISETSEILNIPKTFTINDVRPSSENIPMNVHISPFIDRLCEVTLTLISVDGSERRVYNVSFLHSEKLQV